MRETRRPEGGTRARNCGILAPEGRCRHQRTAAARRKPGQQSRRPWQIGFACPAPSPSAAPGAASPAAPARPTRPPCTAPRSSGPAPSTARPSPGPSPPPSTRPTHPGSPTPAGSAPWPPNCRPCPWRKWPGPKAGPRSPPAPRRRPAPAPSAAPTRTTPNHPKRREISPLNPGTALPRTPVTAGHQSCVVGPPGSRAAMPGRAGRCRVAFALAGDRRGDIALC